MARVLWLADKLRAWGLTVVELDGWRTRGSDSLQPRAVLAHHTGGASTGEIPSLRVLRDGRSNLPGPLAHVGLGRSGTCYVIASGRCNHAGAGRWLDITSGNTSMMSVEAENDGRQGWPSAQIEAYVTLCAALCDGMAVSAAWVAGHKEYATPPGRKPDPHGIDMTAFRERVRTLLTEGDDDMTPEQSAKLDAIHASLLDGNAGGVWAYVVATGNTVGDIKTQATAIQDTAVAILSAVNALPGGAGGLSAEKLARAYQAFVADLQAP